LPVSTTSLFGRERAIDEVAGLVERPGVRLVTLTGPGGVGKTRLAVAVGERLRDRFGGSTVFVPLEAVTDPGLALAVIGRAAGADLARTGSALEALAEMFRDGAWLADPGQPGAGARGGPRPGRAAGLLPCAGDLGHQPDGAGAARLPLAARTGACMQAHQAGGGLRARRAACLPAAPCLGRPVPQAPGPLCIQGLRVVVVHHVVLGTGRARDRARGRAGCSG
jgi:hypothetical protein